MKTAWLASLTLLAPVLRHEDERPPAAVLEWLANAATPLVSLEADTSSADLEPLRSIVGTARVVALGEATHGSHEFFQLKLRTLQFLVQELGFTDFVMETDWVRAQEANAWVERGEGDLDAALRSLSVLWQTQEYRDLLGWMRAWNADPAHVRKLRFHGMDLGSPQIAAGRVSEFLGRADPELAESIVPLVTRMGNGGAGIDEADLEGIVGLFDELRGELIDASAPAEWARARRHAVLLTQLYRQRTRPGNQGTAWRDVCMADCVRWILEQAGPEARVLVSAHNGHVSRAGLFEVPDEGVITSVGRELAADPGASLCVIGCAFARGGFRAFPGPGTTSAANASGLAEFRIDEPDPAGIEAGLLSAGLGNALIDLSSARGEARAWLQVPRPMRFVGGQWSPSDSESGSDRKSAALTSEFDALYFIVETRAAQGLR